MTLSEICLELRAVLRRVGKVHLQLTECDIAKVGSTFIMQVPELSIQLH